MPFILYVKFILFIPRWSVAHLLIETFNCQELAQTDNLYKQFCMNLQSEISSMTTYTIIIIIIIITIMVSFICRMQQNGWIQQMTCTQKDRSSIIQTMA